MGLLSQGKPLPWDEAKKYSDDVRRQGIQQLLVLYHRLKSKSHDQLKWGDEVEASIIYLDHDTQRARLSLRSSELLQVLKENTDRDNAEAPELAVIWHPEFASYMIESTPGNPYGGKLTDFIKVEPNMLRRRTILAKYLQPGEIYVTVTNFPRLGCPGFTWPEYLPAPDGTISQSLFFPDQALNAHPRFATLVRNIRDRRGKKVAINNPIFRDVHTPDPFVEKFLYTGPGEGASSSLPDHIYLDAMGFGMGCSCLQITFQACSLSEARYLFDQLAVVAPIMLALSAGSPVFRGYLSKIDCRWSTIASSVDDRTDEERGLAPLDKQRFVIPKSRYDCVDAFISDGPMYKAKYNDTPLVVDEDIVRTLTNEGMDLQLARHFGHLFVRDPLVLYEELLQQDKQTSTDHFENIQSTNWQTIRFKPPPPDSDIGWRVEFRPCEVQLTDFENAAFTVFIALLTRTIVSFDLNLYMPMSKVEENMTMAQQIGAAKTALFYFRSNISGHGNQHSPTTPSAGAPVSGPEVPGEVDDGFEVMSIDTIINGKPGGFRGLVPLVELYLNSMNCDIETRSVIARYLMHIRKKAAGERVTTATWMRSFITTHPDYKHDSVVSEKINYDLIRFIDRLAKGEVMCPELLGNIRAGGTNAPAEMNRQASISVNPSPLQSGESSPALQSTSGRSSPVPALPMGLCCTPVDSV